VAKFLRRRQRTLRDVLEGLGMSAEEIDAAKLSGTAALLAIDGVVLPEADKLTIDDLAGKVGVDVDVIRALWRGLGFVDPLEGERSFGKRDVKILRSLVALTADDLIEPDLALQLTRVLGVSMAKVATAVVDATQARSPGRRAIGDMSDTGEMSDIGDTSDGDFDAEHEGQDDADLLAVRAGELVPFLSDVITYTFRRHLRAAARRQVALATSADGASQVIGFADLVRFTVLSSQLEDHELAQVVDRFDHLVNSIVVRHGGRVIKMIGDAAMFTCVNPVQAGLIALELVDAVADDDRLSGLRVGMASGPVLARDGDLYGSVVNMASRLVTIGRAGAVNVSQDVRDALTGDDRFSLRSLGDRTLRHIGEVRVYRLRSGAEWVIDPVEALPNGHEAAIRGR
jgi:adenylate cyclase